MNDAALPDKGKSGAKSFLIFALIGLLLAAIAYYLIGNGLSSNAASLIYKDRSIVVPNVSPVFFKAGEYVLDGATCLFSDEVGKMPTRAYTIAFKFKADPDGAKCGGFLSYGNYTVGGSTNMIRLAGNTWVQHHWWGDSGATGVETPGDFMDGEWHEVICAYDRDRHVRYICADTLPVNQDVPKGGRIFDPPLVTGCIGKAWDCFFKGTMADIAVWDVCVPQS